MPHLVLLCRKWDFSTDECVYYGIGMAVGNALNVALCFVLAMSSDVDDPLSAAFLGTGASSIVLVLLNVLLALISARGSVLDPSPRDAVPCLLRLDALAVLSQVVCVALETIAVGMADELGELKHMIHTVLIFHWLGLILLMIWSSIWFKTMPDKMRCLVRCLACLVGRRKDDQDIQDVYQTLNQYVDEEATTGDVIVGQLLLSNMQCAARRGECVPDLASLQLVEDTGYPWTSEEERLLAQSRGGALPGTIQITDRALIEELLHFLCYATAVCGILLHLFSGRGSLRKVHPMESSPTYTHAAHKRALLATLQEWPGHKNSRLIYLSDRNDIKCTVYAVFVNPDRRELVVAVRGTLSISDAFTDVLAAPEFITDPMLTGGGEGQFYVHSGMWSSARNVVDDIDARGCLSTLLSGGDGQNLPNCTGFQVIVTGHSLGSGTAQLLTAVLRPKYPKVRCFGFGSPHPWSEAFAKYMSPCMTQVINGDDIIARLSIRNAELLKDRMRALTAYCTWPKYKIIRRGLRDMSKVNHEGYISKQVVSNFARECLVHFANKPASLRFYHSGRIVYLRVLDTKKGCCGASVTDTKFQADWAESDHFMEMIVSRRMMIVHMPDNYRQALELVLQDMPV